MTMTSQEGAAWLRRLGERRKRHEQEGRELADAIRLALQFTEGEVDRSEAARLLGLDRSAMYRTYLDDRA